MKDGEFLADLLIAASKLLAQEAVYIRFREFGRNIPVSSDCAGTINAAVRCQILAEKYRDKPGAIGAEKLS